VEDELLKGNEVQQNVGAAGSFNPLEFAAQIQRRPVSNRFSRAAVQTPKAQSVESEWANFPNLSISALRPENV
jgi:hypothetical protein